MIKKSLLSLGLLASAITMSAQAPVFHESFDAAQTKTATDVGYYEFINNEENDSREISTDAFKGAGAMNFFNLGVANDNNWWRRAIKFRNLPLQEGKSYRLVHHLKGSNTYNEDGTAEKKCQVSVALMQGGENADIPLLDANGNEFRYTYQYLNPENYEKYTHMFYFASKENQDAKYNEKHTGAENYSPDAYFATINIFNPGDFYLDEVDLIESPIAGIEFNNDVLRVNFGYATNIATLANASATGRIILPNELASVKVNGEEVAVEAVELKSDGYLYIFLENYTEEADNIEVTFTNPDGESQITYTGTLAPEGAAYSFAGEVAEYNENITGTSWIYEEPNLISTTPKDATFGHELDINEFTFEFDKEVFSVANDMKAVAPSAVLTDGAAFNEQLALMEGTAETTTILKYVRTGKEPLTKGSYKVVLKDVVSSKNIEAANDYVLSFEAGKVQVAKTVYGEYVVTPLTGPNNGQPDGWSLMVGGSNWTGGTAKADNGSACRNINVTGAEGEQTALYLCDREGYTYAMYGDKEGYALTLPAGNIEFGIIALGHEDPARTVEFRLETLDGTPVLTANGTTQVNANTGGFTTLKAAGSISGTFVNDKEQNFILKVHEPQGGFTACRLVAFQYRPFTVTEGDKAETEVVAKGDFSGVGEDCAPAHGTGWKIYRNDGRMRDPGVNCGWGGTCWTGGGGPRVKNVSNKGMGGAAVYLGGNCYSTYGEFDVQTGHDGAAVLDSTGATVPEQTLELKKDKYQITYYILGWKNPGSEYTMKLDIYEQAAGITGEPVYTRVDATKDACSANGSNAEATKVQFFWNAPKEGKYILKFTAGGAGEGECIFGNVSIETTASLAIQYAMLMDKNLIPAKEELETAMANDNYRGATRDELAKTIETYETVLFHSVDEYTEAFANLDRLIKKMQLRRSNIDAFPTSLAGVENGLEAAKGTKYEGLPQFPIVEQAYNDYKDVDYIALDDEALNEAVKVMGNNGSLLANMVNTCVPLITTQITNLSNAIAAICPEYVGSKYEKMAQEVISDDQEVVATLKTIYAAKMYRKIANALAAGQNPFEETDTMTLDVMPVEYETSFLIQNNAFYTTAILPEGQTNVVAKPTDFPGWNIEVIKGNINPIFTTAWGGSVGKDWTSELYPYANCAVKTGWGTSVYNVEQLIGQIPVAKYTASIKIGEDGGAGDEANPGHACYAFCNDSIQQYLGTTAEDGSVSYTRDNNKEENNKIFTGVVPSIEENFGSIKLGAHMEFNGGFGNVDDAKLVMTGVVEGFDYAAAATALESLFDFGGANGDANGDGQVSVADLALMASSILGEAVELNKANADVNGDGEITVADLAAVASMILGQ